MVNTMDIGNNKLENELKKMKKEEWVEELTHFGKKYFDIDLQDYQIHFIETVLIHEAHLDKSKAVAVGEFLEEVAGNIAEKNADMVKKDQKSRERTTGGRFRKKG